MGNAGHIAGYLGFSQGFEYYSNDIHDIFITNLFTRWLGKMKFFTYLHFMTLHDPYLPQKAFDIFTTNVKKKIVKQNYIHDFRNFKDTLEQNKFSLNSENLEELIGLYDGELLEIDAKIGLFFEYLKKENLYDNTLIILIGDHGDGLFEHNFYGHGLSRDLHSELIRVPLIMKFPHNQFSQQIIQQPVQLIDIMPTLLDYFNIAIPDSVSGKSLLHLLRGEQLKRPIFSESNRQTAIYLDGYKYIVDPLSKDMQVYDYINDKKETQNLVATHPKDMISHIYELADQFSQKNRSFAQRHELKQLELDDNSIQKLRSLGYVK